MITLEVEPYYCCGCGRCGPMPSYFYVCPKCEKNTNGRTFYPLEESHTLKCHLCKHIITVVEKKSETLFTFEE